MTQVEALSIFSLWGRGVIQESHTQCSLLLPFKLGIRDRPREPSLAQTLLTRFRVSTCQARLCPEKTPGPPNSGREARSTQLFVLASHMEGWISGPPSTRPP